MLANIRALFHDERYTIKDREADDLNRRLDDRSDQLREQGREIRTATGNWIADAIENRPGRGEYGAR